VKRRVQNCKAKGSRNERRTRDMLQVAGYSVCKAGASLGVWDLIGVGLEDIVLAQVKSNQWPGVEEMERMRNFVAPSNCRRLVYRWRDRVAIPDIRDLGYYEPPEERGLTLPELLEMAGAPT
jgi:hypothetical protein